MAEKIEVGDTIRYFPEDGCGLYHTSDKSGVVLKTFSDNGRMLVLHVEDSETKRPKAISAESVIGLKFIR